MSSHLIKSSCSCFIHKIHWFWGKFVCTFSHPLTLFLTLPLTHPLSHTPTLTFFGFTLDVSCTFASKWKSTKINYVGFAPFPLFMYVFDLIVIFSLFLFSTISPIRAVFSSNLLLLRSIICGISSKRLSLNWMRTANLRAVNKLCIVKIGFWP